MLPQGGLTLGKSVGCRGPRRAGQPEGRTPVRPESAGPHGSAPSGM